MGAQIHFLSQHWDPSWLRPVQAVCMLQSLRDRLSTVALYWYPATEEISFERLCDFLTFSLAVQGEGITGLSGGHACDSSMAHLIFSGE